jgi:tetratricopeptide (TPR) repeat protein
MQPAAAQSEAPTPAWVWILGIAAVFVAGEPLVRGAPQFGSGYVLRLPALMALGLAAALGAGLLRTGGRWPTMRESAWLVLPLAVALLGLLTDSHRSASHRLRDAGPWVALAVLPICLARLLRHRISMVHVWRVLVGLGLVLALCGIAEKLSGGRMGASFGRPAIAGVVFGALLVPAWLFSPFEGRMLRCLPPLLLVGAMVASGSRTAIFAVAVATLFAAWLHTPTTATLRRRRRGFAGGAVALLVLGLLVYADLAPTPGSGKTVEVRRGLHRAATTLIAERPVRGHGLGSYPTVALRARDVVEARLEPRRRPTHAHLDYLHVSVEGGVLAGLALLAWVLAGLLGAWQRARGADAETRRHVATAGAVFGTLAVAALGDGVWIDPAAVLLGSVALAGLLLAPHAEPEVGPRPDVPRVVALVLAALALGAGLGLWSRHALADHAVQQYVNQRAETRRLALAGEISQAAATDRMEQLANRLLGKALRHERDNPSALHQRGVEFADRGKFDRARDHFRAAVEADPGKTESRLDTARTYEIEDRDKDAESALREAVRHDPSRFEVRMRLAHLALGPEPVPGEPPADRVWTPLVRRYNEARALSPDRFENAVAEARLLRRRFGTVESLLEADQLLNEAAAPFAPKHAPKELAHLTGEKKQALTVRERLMSAPAELVLESFRLAEAMRRTPSFQAEAARNPKAVLPTELGMSLVLQLALVKDSALGTLMKREAYRLLEIARTREEEAKVSVATTLDTGDFAPAQRAYDAATIRLAALLRSHLLDAGELLQEARRMRQAKSYRQATARFRALVAYMNDARNSQFIGQHSDGREQLLREAAVAASPVDGDLSREWFGRAFTMRAESLLRAKDFEGAEAAIERAYGYGGNDPDILFLEAVVHARKGGDERAARALLEAIRRNPDLRASALQNPVFKRVRKRPDVAAALR